METCGSILLGLSKNKGSLADNEIYDKAVRGHISNLNKLLKDHSSALQASAAQLLDLLNPTADSISYLTIIDQVLASTSELPISYDVLLRHITLLLVSFDPRQIRYVGAPFLALLERVASGGLLPPLVAVRTVCIALTKLDPTGSFLSSTRCSLVRFAYETDCADGILTLIDIPITCYPSVLATPAADYLCDMDLAPSNYMTRNLTHDLKASQILEYDMVCGLIWCSQRHWEKALEAFERVLNYPTKENGVSKIMVEAYKKWLLVGLLSSGQIPPEPVYVGVGARKAYNVLARPYIALAEVFVTTNAAQLAADAARSQQFWDNDHNATLVTEVLKAYQKWKIIGLREIYSKISISDIRRLTESGESGTTLGGDEEVEKLVTDMINSGMLRGLVSRQHDNSPYLTFLPWEDELSEVDLAHKLSKSAQSLKALGTTLKRTNERLLTSKDYIKYLAREQKRLQSQGEKANTGPGFDAQVEDEDLMTGLLTAT